MVDVSEKPQSARGACASGSIKVSQKVLDALREDKVPKGDVFAAARIAGIMAAKRTSDLIPLCHPLSLSNVTIDFKTLSDKKKDFVRVFCQACWKHWSRNGGVDRNKRRSSNYL
jgi:cyclic pyranopterin phosphate synthase